MARGPALLILAILFASPQVLAEDAGPPPAGTTLPQGGEIQSATIARCMPGSSPLTALRLRRIMDRARPLPPAGSMADPFHYSPWCAGSFVTARGTYGFVLFLGGRGDLTLPGGARVRFEFEP